MNSNEYQVEAIKNLKIVLKYIYSPRLRALIEEAIEYIENAYWLTDHEIEEAYNGAIRGSAFPGDEVGWLSDDFD